MNGQERGSGSEPLTQGSLSSSRWTPTPPMYCGGWRAPFHVVSKAPLTVKERGGLAAAARRKDWSVGWVMWKEWVKERGVEPPLYCPLDREQGAVIVGMNFMGTPREPVVGEFWYDNDGEIHVELVKP